MIISVDVKISYGHVLSNDAAFRDINNDIREIKELLYKLLYLFTEN